MKTTTRLMQLSPLRRAQLWEAVRSEYIHGKLSLRGLAEKHGLLFSTVGKKARRDGWLQDRIKWREIQANRQLPPKTNPKARPTPEQLWGPDRSTWPLSAQPARVLRRTWGSEEPKAAVNG
jgi:hypothetical protein